jgi:endonuclease/exonuclease/phosphatase family metal-dependent hydrolase
MTPLLGPAAAPRLHVMSWNLRRPLPATWPPADRWARRAPHVTALLRAEQPTILGLQEVVPSQLSAVAAGLGDGYLYVGHGRTPGRRGEACPLFFDGRRLELLRWHQRSLSERPEVAGSRSWGNAIPRVLVEATLRDRATGAEVFVVNTHLDVFSARARVQSAGMIAERVRTRGGDAIVLGDFNAPPDSPPLVELTRGGSLADAWEAAAQRLTPAWDTLAGYRPLQPRGRRIDHLLVSPGVTVERIGIRTTSVDERPSDHLPVQAIMRLAGDDRRSTA